METAEVTDIVDRLREYRVSAPPEFPVHPGICDEAAKEIVRLREEIDRRDCTVHKNSESLPGLHYMNKDWS
jgi:hypothetical protein